MFEEFFRRLEDAGTDEERRSVFSEMLNRYEASTEAGEIHTMEKSLIGMGIRYLDQESFSFMAEALGTHAYAKHRVEASYECRTLMYASLLLQGKRGDTGDILISSIHAVQEVMEEKGESRYIHEDAMMAASDALFEKCRDLREQGRPEPVMGLAALDISAQYQDDKYKTADIYFETAYSCMMKGDFQKAYRLVNDSFFEWQDLLITPYANAISYAAAVAGKLPGFDERDYDQLRQDAMDYDDGTKEFRKIISDTDALRPKKKAEAKAKAEPKTEWKPDVKVVKLDEEEDPLDKAFRLYEEGKMDEAYRILADTQADRSTPFLSFFYDAMVIATGAVRKDAKIGDKVKNLTKEAENALKDADETEKTAISRAMTFAALGVKGTRYQKWQGEWYDKVIEILEDLTKDDKGMTENRVWLSTVLLYKGTSVRKPNAESRKTVRKGLMVYGNSMLEGQIAIREKDFMRKSGFVRFMNAILVLIIVFAAAFMAGHVPGILGNDMDGSAYLESTDEELPEWVFKDVSTADMKYASGYGKGETLSESWRNARISAMQDLSDWCSSVYDEIVTEVLDEEGNVISTEARLDYSDIVVMERDGVFAEASSEKGNGEALCEAVLSLVFSAVEYDMYVDGGGGVWVNMGLPSERIASYFDFVSEEVTE